jgi:uncharacterized membrane protein HdeD (DUF308 family)
MSAGYLLIEIIGWLGTIAILTAYFLISTNKIKAQAELYQLLNGLGALGIIINSIVHHALPSLGLNLVWLLIAIYSLFKNTRNS